MFEKLPSRDQVRRLLALREDHDVGDLVERSLIAPLEEFLGRPGKGVRGQLVELGFVLSGEHAPRRPTESEARLLRQGGEVVEALHAGSLVVDDIEDASLSRRGEPTLHRIHGVPLALNAGNWLYFWPLERVAAWGLDPATENCVYRLLNHTLLRAHFGQSLDVGVGIDTLPPERIPPVCLASLELKTGALMALGLSLGAALGGASPGRASSLDDFGHRFGVALQMFDDLGNLKGPKQYEDLRLRRPSWLWAVAARTPTFGNFTAAVRELPDDANLLAWCGEHLPSARREAIRYVDAALGSLHSSLGEAFREAAAPLHGWADKLKVAYES